MAALAMQTSAFIAKPAAVRPRASRNVVVQAAARPTWYPGECSVPM